MSVFFADSLENTPIVETGLFTDKILSGIPRGKMGEITGDASVGKSTLCEQIVASFQQQGLKCLWADVEWSFDAKYAAAMGVETSKLGIIREQSAEDILDAVEKEAATGKWDLIVIDSIGALTPRAELEKMSGEKTIGAQAGLIAKFCRKVVPQLAMHNTCLIGINHTFQDIMSGKIMSSGGKKWSYHISWSLRLKPKFGTVLKQGDKVMGKVIVASLMKDKIGGNEKMECEGQLVFHSGFSRQADLMDEAIRKGVLEKRGNLYFMDETKIGTISKLREWMKGNSELVKEKLNGLRA